LNESIRYGIKTSALAARRRAIIRFSTGLGFNVSGEPFSEKLTVENPPFVKY